MKFQSEYVSVLNNNYGGDVFRSTHESPQKIILISKKFREKNLKKHTPQKGTFFFFFWGGGVER